ncbi:MAG: FAD-dependent monooxygenase [Deltaproteobacteria bacterium]|nr:FAD-dependent monooxygenase [Deltaproteobacteria bacterium]
MARGARQGERALRAIDQHAALLAAYRDWHAPIPAPFRATHPAQVIRTELFDRPPTRTWDRGAVTLLGDAAHPMTPNLGQGGCPAIENAWILARELARDPSPPGCAATSRCDSRARTASSSDHGASGRWRSRRVRS